MGPKRASILRPLLPLSPGEGKPAIEDNTEREEEFQTFVDIAIQDLSIRMDDLQQEIGSFRANTEERISTLQNCVSEIGSSYAINTASQEDLKSLQKFSSGDALAEVKKIVEKNEAELRDMSLKLCTLNKNTVEQMKESTSKLKECEGKLLNIENQMKETVKGKGVDKIQRAVCFLCLYFSFNKCWDK